MITRRQFLAGSAAAAGWLVLPAAARSTPRGLFTPIRRNVGIYEDRGGTIGWLASPDAAVVVDSQFPESASACLEGMRARTERRIDRLVNTHHHGDHTAGNTVLGPAAEHVVAHRNVPDLQRAAAARSGGDDPVVADITFEETWEEELGDEVIRLRHFGPAHTGGDAVVHFERADVVHMGDLVFNRRPPFIDVAGGASTAGWIEVLERSHAAFTDDTVFIFGHANPSYGVTGTRDDLLAMRDFLSGLLEYVQAGIAAGTSVEELAAIERLPEFPDHFLADRPTGIGNAVQAVHSDLTRDP